MAQDVLEEYLNVIQDKQPLSTQPQSTETNSSYGEYYNILQQDEQKEEGPSYSDALMLDYTTKLKKNPQATTIGKIYTLDQLEKDPEFQMRAERFMESIGDDEDIFEYLRDTDFSLSSAIVRAGQVKGWSEEAKADYNYLRNTFDNAEIGSTRQYLQLAGHMTVDLIADPINWLAAAFFIPTAGQSATASAVANLSARQLVKQGLKSATTKKFAQVGAAEGAVWSGPHDYFLQSADVELGMRDEIDWSQVGMSTALGAGLGGVFGGSIGAVTSIAPALSKKIFKYSNEDDIINAGKNVSRELEEESFGIDKAVDEKVKDKRLKKRTQWLSNTFGKYTTQFVEMSENSPALQQLLGRFRYDWARTFTQGAQGVEARSYGIELSERMHNYLFEMQDALQPLSRGSSWFKNTLRQDQNDNLLRLLRQTKKEFDADVASGQAAQVAGQEVVTAAIKIRKVLNNIFEEGVENKLMTRDQFIDHYFPRHFQHSKIKANKAAFIEIIKNSKHSEIQNVYPESAYARDKNNKIITKTLEDGTIEKVLGPNAKWIDEEVFGKNFLTEAGGDENFARQLKAEAIVADMLEKRYNPFQFGTKDNAGGGHAFLQHRVFNDIDDNLLEDFLENDVEEVLEQYITGASRAITRTKFFGKTKADFEKRWLIPISKQLRESGVDGDEVTEVTRRLRLMHERVTGLDTDQIRFKGKFATNTLDTLKLTQQMAHLPLATLSSLTEPLILLSRIDSTSGKFAASKEVGKALVKGIKKDWDKFIHYSKRVSGQDVKGRAEMTDEYWHEAYKVGLAMEQAVMDRIESLTGEALEGSLAKRLQNAFFKANFLSSWTGAVQLASFTTGKRLIRENTEQLVTGKTLAGNKLSQSKREYLTKQLHELGIDEKKAKEWYKLSIDPKTGLFDEGRGMGTSSSLRKYEQKRQVAFYKNQYQHGANRFTREIILNPSTAEANRPLWFSHPAGQLLAQFAGYPTVFNNTVLKRWINEGIFEHKRQTTAKIAGTALAMTSIAVFTNAVRSGGRSLEEDEGKIILEAIQRWGGLGPMDYAYRFQQNATTGSGQAATLLKTPTGPIVSDVVDAAIYRKGLFQTLGTNVPFYSALPKDIRDSMKKSTKDIDKAFWGNMFPQANKKTTTLPKRKSIPYSYAKGGVVNVPNASTEPDEKKVRGMPFTYAELGGVLAQDVEDRRGFVFGGLVNRILRAGQRGLKITDTDTDLDDELVQYLTKDFRKAEPIFESNATTSLYKQQEADEFANIEGEAVRYIDSDKLHDLESELRYSNAVGVEVSTKPKKSGGKKLKQKGRLRLVRPLDLTEGMSAAPSNPIALSDHISVLVKDRPSDKIPFAKDIWDQVQAYSNNPEFKGTSELLKKKLIQESPLPDEDATKRIQEFAEDFYDTNKLLWNNKDDTILKNLFEARQSFKLRELLTDLGFDSIKTKDAYTLFDNNQFRVTKKQTYRGFKDFEEQVDFESSPLGLYSKSFAALENLPDKLFQGKNKTVREQDLEKHLLGRGFKKPQIQEMLIALSSIRFKKGLIPYDELNKKLTFTREELIEADREILEAFDNLEINVTKTEFDSSIIDEDELEFFRVYGADPYEKYTGRNADPKVFVKQALPPISLHFSDDTAWKLGHTAQISSTAENTHFAPRTLSWTRASNYINKDKKSKVLIEELQAEIGGQKLREPYNSNWDRYALLARFRETAKDPEVGEIILTTPAHLETAGMQLNKNAMEQWYDPQKGRYVAAMRDIAKEFGGEVKYKKYPFMQSEIEGELLLSENSVNSINQIIDEDLPNAIDNILEKNNIDKFQYYDYAAYRGDRSEVFENFNFPKDQGYMNDIVSIDEIFGMVIKDFRIRGEEGRVLPLRMVEREIDGKSYYAQKAQSLEEGITTGSERPLVDIIEEWGEILDQIFKDTKTTDLRPAAYIELTDEFRKNLLELPARLFKYKGGVVRLGET